MRSPQSKTRSSSRDRYLPLPTVAQFPVEDEVLFSPAAALEVAGTRVEGSVLVVEVRPTPSGNALALEFASHKEGVVVANHLTEEIEELVMQKSKAEKETKEAIGKLQTYNDMLKVATAPARTLTLTLCSEEATGQTLTLIADPNPHRRL